MIIDENVSFFILLEGFGEINDLVRIFAVKVTEKNKIIQFTVEIQIRFNLLSEVWLNQLENIGNDKRIGSDSFQKIFVQSTSTLTRRIDTFSVVGSCD
jgi:hypothetical protein